jgi:hypothetical protein
MLHRLTIMLIVGFWLAMTGLLVVRELYPESTRLNDVPLSYVGQLVFQHEQSSDLRIYTSEKEPGYLHIQPRNAAGSGDRILDMNGSVNLTLPGARAQRLSWAAVFVMSRDFSPLRLNLDLSTNEPGQHLDVTVDFAGKKASFGAKVGAQVMNETSFSLDEAGFGMLMARAGVDPMMMRQLKASQGEIPKFEWGAQSSSTAIAGQKLSTFLVSLKAGGQSVIEMHLSQLGQVLSASAPALGWKFVPLNLTR